MLNPKTSPFEINELFHALNHPMVLETGGSIPPALPLKKQGITSNSITSPVPSINSESNTDLVLKINKTLLIVGSSVVGAFVIGLIVYLVITKKQEKNKKEAILTQTDNSSS